MTDYAPSIRVADVAAAASGPRIAQKPSIGERRTGARLIALGLALKAKLGEADEKTMTQAVVATDDVLEADDPVRVEVKAIARQWPQLRFGGPVLMDAGEELFRAVIRSSWPAPSGRADLDG